MLTRDDLLKGRDKAFPSEFTQTLSDNLDNLLVALNKFIDKLGYTPLVNSGYRPQAVNAATPGAAKGSKHTECLACDFNDPDGKIFQFCLDNMQLLVDLNLYLENPNWTRTAKGGRWLHMQLGGPKSRKRIFVPNDSLPLQPRIWDEKYESRFDK